MSPQTFSYTGSAQTWTVPAGVTSVTIDMAAGQGFDTAFLGAGTAGKGGRVQCVLPANAGDTWQINVGGGNRITPFNGTSNGGGANGKGGSGGGPGGGATDIRIGGTALANRKVTAGAGGGDSSSGFGGGLSGRGGDGGDTTGATAPTADPGGGNNQALGGGGGTQSAGGAGGHVTPGFGTSGGAGSLGVGGPGATDYTGAGGGGAGYYGGGGGGDATGGGCSGGGGGSSYTDAGATSVVHTQGYRSGDGYVTLTWSVPAATSSGTPNFELLGVG